ncbi:MAG: hypothetical protein AMXMBFR34_38970 [Myxococcaceae bacterium]
MAWRLFGLKWDRRAGTREEGRVALRQSGGSFGASRREGARVTVPSAEGLVGKGRAGGPSGVRASCLLALPRQTASIPGEQLVDFLAQERLLAEALRRLQQLM